MWPITLDSLRHEAVRGGGPRDGGERLSGSDWARSTRQGGTPVADVGERRLRRIEIDDLWKSDISTGLAASMEVLFELVREGARNRRNQQRVFDRQIAAIRVRRHRGALERAPAVLPGIRVT